MRTTPLMRSFEAAALVLTFAGSSALATPILTGPLAPSPDAAVIANLTDMYLKASVGATNTGKWLHAAAGNPPGQSLIIPGTTVAGPNPGQVTIDSFNNLAGAQAAIVTFDNGAGGKGTVNTSLTQFEVSYTSGGTTVLFDTFCIDLLHAVTDGQTYAVTPRNDLDAAFTNGARMAFVIDNFGAADLSSNPGEAAAVQITLWDLSLNHNPTFFRQDADGTTYSSGDPDVFKVAFHVSVSEPSSAGTMLASLILLGVWDATRHIRKPS
jgi:hypothetical protein